MVWKKPCYWRPILTNFVKIDVTGAKINIFESDFFAASENWHTITILKFFILLQKLSSQFYCKIKSKLNLAIAPLTNFTKIHATGVKIDFFKIWFFCWVANLINYHGLKNHEAALKNELIRAFWKLLSFFILP